MRCIVFANGEITDYRRIESILRPDDYIVCADGGLKHLIAMDRLPNVLVGDLDSVHEEHMQLVVKNNVKVLKFPSHKDETDTEIAIMTAVKKKPDEILLIGVTGGRLDHTLGNIGLLKELYDKGIRAQIVSEYNIIYITNDVLEITGQRGDLLSVLPISEHVKGITLEGLEYPLTDRDLHFGAPIGISNVFLGEKAKVSIKSGYVLVMKAFEKED